MLKFLFGYLIGSSQYDAKPIGVLWRLIGSLAVVGVAGIGLVLYFVTSEGQDVSGSPVGHCRGNSAVAAAMCDAASDGIGAGSVLLAILGFVAGIVCILGWVAKK